MNCKSTILVRKSERPEVRKLKRENLSDLCGLADFRSYLLYTIKYLKPLRVFAVAFKCDAIIYTEYQPLQAYVKLLVIAVIVFGKVISTDDLIQL